MATSSEPEKYEILETIGRGSFGTIRKVRRAADGHILCRKEIQYIKMSQKEREQLHAEFSILNSLKHPNIVGYYHREHLKPTQELYLYMEYCGGGDLSKEIEKLKKANQYADEEYVWSIFSQLICALYRCHYGIDPPEVKNVFGPKQPTKPLGLKTKNQVMILHRDLKPENVFLGVDSSVKLGDFGLSKLMQSHDFASTYVGTPFYMSPEICAAERYTLQSDIWSLGCVIYELCARAPPFNAKTHFHLIQKIKEGRLDPLPAVYSRELQNVIKDCLNVNPLKRPDTATLLDLPAVRLTRQQREVVELAKILKGQQAQLNQQMTVQTHSAAKTATQLENERQQLKADLEASLRREWEVKAGLEISRQVAAEKEKLNAIFDAEVSQRVEAALTKALRAHNLPTPPATAQSSFTSTNPSTTAEDTTLPSSTSTAPSLSSLSLCSPSTTTQNPHPIPISPTQKSQTPPPRRRLARGPLARARTQFDSPMDHHMADPSPMSIDSLSLSPRRTAPSNKGANIFSAAALAAKQTRLQPLSPTIAEDEDEEHSNNNNNNNSPPDLPSPTRAPQSLSDPFKPPPPQLRPALLRQKTMPTNRLHLQQQTQGGAGGQGAVLFPPTQAERPTRVPSPPSPKHSGFSPVRKAPPKPVSSATTASGTGMGVGMGQENEGFKAVVARNLNGGGAGRTLVELAQARVAGGGSGQGGLGEKKESVPELVPMWDPERDEMPSPFLVRGGRGAGRRV